MVCRFVARHAHLAVVTSYGQYLAGRGMITGEYRSSGWGAGVVVCRFSSRHAHLAVVTSYGQYLAGRGT